MLENSQQEPHPIFSAITLGNIGEVNEIIEKDSSVLNEIDKNGHTPFFIAILYENKEIVRMIIKKNHSVLIKKHSILEFAPIFLAIKLGNLNIINEILRVDSSVLKQTDRNGYTPLSLATLISCSSSWHEKTKKSEVLKTILKNQFQANITEDAQGDLEELFLQKLLLNGLYSEGEAYSDLKKLKNTFDKIAPKNTFKETYKELFEKVDKNQQIDSKNGEKMFIFSSDLIQHKSYFIFHVDKNNKLTSISYCDGNPINEERKIKDSETHINGVTTFHLKAPIEYSYEKFVKNFIEKNTQNQKIENFYKKYSEKTIAIEGAEIDYAKTTHSIPTRAQKRDNCAFKGPSVAVRFISQQQNPKTMDYGFDEKTKKPTGNGHHEYKKFKDGLTKNALDFIMKIKEKISSKSDPLSEYLKKEIADFIKIAMEYNTKKLSKNDYSRKEFHRAIRNKLIGHEHQTPRSSCFPFFRSCFTLKNTSPQP